METAKKQAALNCCQASFNSGKTLMPQGRCTKAAVLHCCIYQGVMQTPGPRGLSYVTSPIGDCSGWKERPSQKHDPSQEKQKTSQYQGMITCVSCFSKTTLKDHPSIRTLQWDGVSEELISEATFPLPIIYPSHPITEVISGTYFIWDFGLSFHLRLYLAKSPTSISSIAQHGMLFPAV